MPVLEWRQPETRMLKNESVAGLLADLPQDERNYFLSNLSEEESLRALYTWELWARPNQLAPKGSWRTWLVLAGRGFGKTRLGAEWVRQRQETGKYGRFAFIGRSAADVRDVMVEGEALALETPIPTPNGWSTMGDIQIGDDVISSNGKPTKVIWVSSIAYNRPCYLVKFSNGSEMIADANHKWLTHTQGYRTAKKQGRQTTKYSPTIVTTEEIAKTIRFSYTNINHAIPLAEPLDLPKANLLIDPYVLGVWLGDGTKRDARITTMDREVLENIQAAGYEINKLAGDHGQASDYGIIKLLAQLKSLNLQNNKHVPEVYLRASIEQRLALLQGLMDTDGYISPRGQCTFDNTNYQLVLAVRELACSLGIKVGPIKTKVDKRLPTYLPMFRVSFLTKLPVFRIERKLSRLVGPKNTEATYNFVISVEPCSSVPVKCIAVDDPSHMFLVGESMIPTHNSGLINISPPWNRPTYQPSKRRVEWPNGAIAVMFSADEPDQLRGWQSDSAWADELAAWRYPDAWDQLQFGLRLGLDPRTVVTTTPRPTKFLRQLASDSNTFVTPGSTYDNLSNLAPAFADQIIKRYQGTRLGRQEIEGQILNDIEGALWTMRMFETRKHPESLRRVVVGVDPSTEEEGKGAEAGIIVAAIDNDKIGYILADRTIRAGPNGWAQAAVDAYDQYHADVIVAEKNNGGAMVEALLRTIRPNLSYKGVIASRGKQPRAEPIVSLYEQRKVYHVDEFTTLEEQLTTWTPNDSNSPDRLDALVWALTELMIEPVDPKELKAIGFGSARGTWAMPPGALGGY